MRAVVHALLVVLGAIPWLFSMALMCVVALFAVAADKVIKDSTDGNCWSWSLARWVRYGGYLLLRRADGVWTIHVAWVHRLPTCRKCDKPGLVLQQLMPIRRRRGWRGWLHAFYFRGRVTENEASRTSAWGGLDS